MRRGPVGGRPRPAPAPARPDCCEVVASRVDWYGGRHGGPFGCPDALIRFGAGFQECGLIVRDGGASGVAVGFCLWCGQGFPESRRGRRLGELERRGIDPGEEEVPAGFQDGGWLASLRYVRLDDSR
ncbi:DUF6980 family protein [Kitasatospora sp. NPDC059800]|uniref:DUF6980 family protein n=1 Tax=Kitasatospora sp. NPDC059800 TaxID=3346951 RepID=UPI00365550F8